MPRRWAPGVTEISYYVNLAVVCAGVLLASPAWAQDYPPESEPRVPVEFVLRAMGLAVWEDAPVQVADAEPIVIDLGVVVTSGLSTSFCQQVLDSVNATLTGGGVGHVSVRLRDCYLASYVGSGLILTDLNRITNASDGFLDEVHIRRNLYGVDGYVMVSTSRENENADGSRYGSCGMGWRPSTALSAFAVVADNCAIGNFSAVHEWLHNIGLDHDKPNTPTPYLAYGHGQCGNNGQRDVMVYPSPCGGSRIARVSNPLVPYVSGSAGGSTAEADGARVVRERAATFATFRAEVEPSVFGVAPSALTWTPAPTGTAPSNLAWTPGPAGTPPSNLTWQADPPQPPRPPSTTARLVYKVAFVPIEIEGSSQGRPQTEEQIRRDAAHMWWMLDSHNQATVQAVVAPWITLPRPASGTDCPFGEYYQIARARATEYCPDCSRFAMWIPWASCNPHAGGSYIGLTSDQLCCGSTFMHEMGHTFGLYEAQGERCETVNGSLSCTSVAYDDKDDIMGSSISALGFAPPAKALTFGWAWYEGLGTPYIPGQIVYDVAKGPGEYWIEEQTIRTNLLHKALVLRPSLATYFISLDRGLVRIRVLGTVKDLDTISSAVDRTLDVGQTYDLKVGGFWGGTAPVHWRITNVGFEGTGVRIRIEDVTQ